MQPVPAMNPSQTDALLHRAAAGDSAAWGGLLNEQQARLRRMVALRLDRRLQGRIDPSDILQEAYLWAGRQLEAYLPDPKLPFFLWLRLVTGQRMMRIHREHLGAAMRDVGREVSLYNGALPQASSVSLAAQLLGRYTPASQAVSRAEVQLQIQAALNGMELSPLVPSKIRLASRDSQMPGRQSFCFLLHQKNFPPKNRAASTKPAAQTALSFCRGQSVHGERSR